VMLPPVPVAPDTFVSPVPPHPASVAIAEKAVKRRRFKRPKVKRSTSSMYTWWSRDASASLDVTRDPSHGWAAYVTDSFAAWLSAFAFTQAVEVPIYIFGLGIDGAEDATVARRAAIGFGASALTHPIVWFVIPGLLPWASYWSMVAVAETFAVLVEALY